MARPRAHLADVVPWIADGIVPPTRDTNGHPLIRLQTLGAAVVQCGEMRICPSAGVLFGLMIRLSHATAMRTPRDELLELLWPEQKDVRRRASLRQALYKLRQLGVRVGLDGDVVQLDSVQVVRTFANERTAACFERDVTTGYEPFGPFLPGYVAPTAGLEEWVGIEREVVHAQVRQVLVVQLRMRRERADWAAGEALARWLLRFDPLHEDATLMVAECTMLAGAKAEAIAILDRYLAEIGPGAGDMRLPALQMRRRFVEAAGGRLSFAPTERHFVGRDDEMTAFTLAMRRARWRDGSAVLLHGPSGMGKTRMTIEVGKVATVEGVREVRGSCCESDGLRILSVVLDMLPELMAQPGALGCEPESMATLQRLVPECRNHPDGRSPTESSDTRELCSPSELSIESVLAREPLPMPSSIRRAIVDLVAAVSDERPLMLVIDNVHWLDAASWDVLADIMERISEMRLLVVMTSREPFACAERPERVPSSLRVRELPPLTAEHAATLARLIGEDFSAPVSDAICRWFVDACEGSPLFLRSLVIHWIETGEFGGVPPTLEQVMESRIAKLSSDALRTLQTIALLGELASVERAQRVLDSSTLQLLDSLDELARASAFRESTTSKLECHELLGRAAVGSLSRPALTMLHFRIAGVLTADRFDEGGSVSLAVIEHLSRAGEWAHLTEYARARGEQLLQKGHPTRTLALCDAAKRATLDEIDDPQLRHVELEALYSAGRYSQLIVHLSRQGNDFQVAKSWDAEHPESVVKFVEAARHSDSFDDFENQCARATILAETECVLDHLRVRAAITAIKVAGHGLNDSLPKRAYDAARPVCERLPNSQVERALLDMYFHTAFGDPHVALQASQRLLIRCVPNQNPRDRIFLTSDIACSMRVCGAIDEARNLFERTFNEGSNADLALPAGIAAWYLSLIAIDENGDLTRAKNWLARCTTLRGFEGEALLHQLMAAQLARIAIEEQDLATAVRSHSKGIQLSPNAIRPKNLAYRLAIELGIARLADDLASVWRLLPEAQSMFARLKTSLGQDFLASQIIRALRLIGHEEEAADIFKDYVNHTRRERSKIPTYLETAIQS